MAKPPPSRPTETPAGGGLRFGLGLVAALASAAAAFNLVAAIARDGLATPLTDAVVDPTLKLFGIALVAWALVRAGDFLKFKYGGLEVQLGRDLAAATETANANANDLKAEIDGLKKKLGGTLPDLSGLLTLRTTMLAPDLLAEAAGSAPEIPVALPQGAPKPMPRLAPPSVPDDVNKGRFGGRSERDGHRLSVAFLNSGPDDRVVPIVLSVRRIDEEVLTADVHFFLHDSFATPELVFPAVDGVASTGRILIWGGFTVGAWVEGTEVLLELDLALEPKAPLAVRTR